MDPGLRRLALRTLLAAFPGTTVPDWAVGLVTEGLAGYTLFHSNIGAPVQVAMLTAQLREARRDAIIAIDEEAGDVTRLAHATGSPYPGNAALGAIDDPELTRRVYRAAGAELATLGITLDLAPTVDVNTEAENPIIGTRSFGSDAALVARHSVAAVAGLGEAGVAACAKHFPGHGATLADSHTSLPTVDAAPAVLRERDLEPFTAVIKVGVPSIMTAHIRVPALTGPLPATFSTAALRDLLRRELGFTGAVITDALEMRGATLAAGGIGPGAVRALVAGADLLCIGARVDAPLVEEVAAAIVDAVADGSLDLARLEDAAGRVAALAGLWRGPGPASGPATELGYAAARRAVRIEGSVAGLGKPLLVHLDSAPTIAEGRVPWGLGPHVNGTDQLRVAATVATADGLLTTAGGRPIVLVGRHIHRSAPARTLVEELAARHPVAVVEMGWPAPWRPAGARAFVVTYGASQANGHAAAHALGLV